MQLGRRNRVSRVAMSASKESREEATRRAPVDRSRLFARPKSRVEEVPRCLILLSCYIARFSRPGSPYSRSHSLPPESPLTNFWMGEIIPDTFWNRSYWMLFCHGCASGKGSPYPMA